MAHELQSMFLISYKDMDPVPLGPSYKPYIASQSEPAILDIDPAHTLLTFAELGKVAVALT